MSSIVKGIVKGFVKGVAFLLTWEFFLLGLWVVLVGAGAQPLPLFTAIASDLEITVYDLANGLFIFLTMIGIMVSFIIGYRSDSL